MPRKKLTPRQVGKIQTSLSTNVKRLLDDKLIYGSKSNVRVSANKLMELFTGLLNRIV